MHINDSLCPPPMQWGAEQGEVPPPSCREREVNVYQSYCQLPCGHGVGNGGGGSTAPFFWHWSPFTKSPWWSQGMGLEVLGAEVKTVL